MPDPCGGPLSCGNLKSWLSYYFCSLTIPEDVNAIAKGGKETRSEIAISEIVPQVPMQMYQNAPPQPFFGMWCYIDAWS